MHVLCMIMLGMRLFLNFVSSFSFLHFFQYLSYFWLLFLPLHHLQGFAKEFTSLHSLIIHHSIMQELLPCPLNLAVVKRKKEDCHGKSEQRVEGNKFTNHDTNVELLVDVDSDPDYQQILTQFRKSMVNCI